jgi:hypothetical protein
MNLWNIIELDPLYNIVPVTQVVISNRKFLKRFFSLKLGFYIYFAGALLLGILFPITTGRLLDFIPLISL